MTSYGWECPGCGYVWNPYVEGCKNCNRPPHLQSAAGTTFKLDTDPLPAEGEEAKG